MTLARGTDRRESARLVRRRIAPDDLPFFARIPATGPTAARSQTTALGAGLPIAPDRAQ